MYNFQYHSIFLHAITQFFSYSVHIFGRIQFHMSLGIVANSPHIGQCATVPMPPDPVTLSLK